MNGTKSQKTSHSGLQYHIYMGPWGGGGWLNFETLHSAGSIWPGDRSSSSSTILDRRWLFLFSRPTHFIHWLLVPIQKNHNHFTKITITLEGITRGRNRNMMQIARPRCFPLEEWIQDLFFNFFYFLLHDGVSQKMSWVRARTWII